jgi:hypothetical protein
VKALEGQHVRYLSRRSVRGYPYVAEALLEAWRRRDGVLVWRPRGPRTRLGSGGVPDSWYRVGTAREREAQERLGAAPRPWEPVEEVEK